MKDSESWVLVRPAGVGAKALATAKKAKRAAKTFIVDVDCRKRKLFMTVDVRLVVCAKEFAYRVSIEVY